jgi:hypothetical protein
MIRKYELYPKCTCSVRGERTSTKLVLLSRRPADQVKVIADKRYLRVTVDSPARHTFLKLCAAAQALGFALIKSESAPVSWDEGRYGSVLTFEIGNGGAEEFLLYLTLLVPECSEKSIYTEIR